VTPLAARFARRVGAVSKIRERGLGKYETPLLGGLAILAGVLVAAALWMPDIIRLPRLVGAKPGTGGGIVHT
jgi:UDP-GlcNAc:undecaprenyl-phosphate GlcNAc-1-phosphate transferase